ncbi:hypothetical protein [Armatimonas sp.]|uniref:hypothetical protein n=1 Tax=Armatimonas sp. TaxID=1872638 RepID=UPI003751DECF
MFTLGFCPLDTAERQEMTLLCQRFLNASESDRIAAHETLVALCELAGAPCSPLLLLSDLHIWHLKRLVWNYAGTPRMLLSETIWLSKRLQ